MALDAKGNEPNKTDDRKRRFLEELEKARGIVTTAAQNAGINRSTYYDWYDTDPEFKAAVEAVNESCIDWVESKLHEKINGVQVRKGTDDEGEDVVYDLPPSDTAIIFYLKTKAKKRGYIEKVITEHELPNGPLIQLIESPRDDKG